jgi:hypothetical protein
VYFKKMILYGAETWECTERGKWTTTANNWDEIPERISGKNQER